MTKSPTQQSVYHYTNGHEGIARRILNIFHGLLALSLIIGNTLFWVFPLVTLAILKALIPITPFKKAAAFIIEKMAMTWVRINNFNINWLLNITWDVRGVEKLNMRDWYLVLSNHQSWVDIVVLQHVFAGHIPFIKFFLKKELIWVPFLGVAWWGLDFPFMKRYSKEVLKKKPHLKGKDIEVTRKACEKFRYKPISIMNFVEGTRFTDEKKAKYQSPYQNLLKPRGGGSGYVITVMGDQINYILDVTIVYPGGTMELWDMLKGKLKQVVVDVETIPLTDDLRGDYVNDDNFRQHFNSRLNSLWEKKDMKIDRIMREYSSQQQARHRP